MAQPSFGVWAGARCLACKHQILVAALFNYRGYIVTLFFPSIIPKFLPKKKGGKRSRTLAPQL